MEGLTASSLLDVYERGRRGGSADRAALLLGAANQGAPADSFSVIPLGARDTLLLDLYGRTFGGTLEGAVACPGCGEMLELPMAVADLLADTGAEAAWRHLAIEGYNIEVRAPTGQDLAAAAAQPDVSAARALLLERCVRCSRNGRSRSPHRLPAAVIERVGGELAAGDPRAAVDLALRCPACGQDHVVTFDIASFLWEEIRAWVPRLLEEVHTLASAYGWSEADILAMSAWRRRAYLDLVHR